MELSGATMLQTLAEVLVANSFSLALSPGFFQFYAEMGFLHALEERHRGGSILRKVAQVSGASAGALVGGFFAAGMKPSEMLEPVFSIRREDIWDVSVGPGLLEGQLFQRILQRFLPVQDFKDCRIPLAVTAYDVLGFKTTILREGEVATAIRASCCFPVLFQPVTVLGSPHIDGGVFDTVGLMGLDPEITSRCTVIVNLVCGRSRLGSSLRPQGCPDSTMLISIVIDDSIPRVSPFNMETGGPAAYLAAMRATKSILDSPGQQIARNHFVYYLVGQQQLSGTLAAVEAAPAKRSSKKRGGGAKVARAARTRRKR